MNHHVIAEIGDPMPWIVFAAIVIAILGLIGLGLMLGFVRKVRKDLADEIGRELQRQAQAQSQSQKVDVAQPFVVTPHEAAATVQQLETVKVEVHGRIKRERAEIDQQIARVEAAATERAKEMTADLKENTRLTSHMSGELKLINQNLQTLSSAVTQFLRDRANAT